MSKKTPSQTHSYLSGREIKTIQTANSFHIEKVCGEGGMGFFYIGRREKGPKPYDLKTLKGWDGTKKKKN